MNGQPIIPDILPKMPPGMRTWICLLSYLAISVSCNSYQIIGTDNWGIPTPYIHKVNYIWAIDWPMGPSKMEANDILLSPYFSPPSAPEYKLQLIMYPRNPVFPDYVVVKFIYVSGPLSVIHNDVQFTVLDKARKGVLTVNARKSDEMENMYKIAERKWFEDNADTVLTSNGQLRLVMSTEIRHTNCSCDNQCNTTAVVKPAALPTNCSCDNQCNTTAVVNPAAPPTNCRCDDQCKISAVDTKCYLYKYARNKIFSDATIEMSDKTTFPVHKVLMAAQSSVLLKAYGTSNTFKATDIDRDTMTELIYYLYCGFPHQLPVLAEKLLAAAESLMIDGLKKLCEVQLNGRINVKSNQTEVKNSNSSNEINQ